MQPDYIALEEEIWKQASQAIIRVLKENINGCSAKHIWNILRFSQFKTIVSSEHKTKEMLENLAPHVKASKEQPPVYKLVQT